VTTILKGRRGWPSILLARAGAKDPTDLAAATKAGAFAGLRRVIQDLGPTGFTATVATSGLRGRGGAGFPAGDKWRLAAVTDAPRKFVVANGYGADPAAGTDRTLMEVDPYAVVEGTAIAAHAIGATEAFIAVRAENTVAIRNLESAIAAAEAAGHIGISAMGSGRELWISVRAVQGAYMLGEETVLLKALEGKRGQPEQRPPYPAERGLFDLPTVVHNVQTLALLPWIAVNGSSDFAAIGDGDAPGTVLVGVRTPAGAGIAEVPLGTTLGEIIGLAGETKKLKAILVGGPSGGILPADRASTPYTFEALRVAGAHLGSGSVVAADGRACVVDLANLLTRFCANEACGKSIPCRIGTRRVSEIGERIQTGQPEPTDLDLLADLSADIVGSALCDHERLATLPLASGMRYFRSELDDHILRSHCPAGVCRPIAMATAGAH
jgi:NADH:ubiquinone oxidoreductase subunit F (NADH-binding)